jgi:RNA polymerase sigma-70 factor, ECF subfamily
MLQTFSNDEKTDRQLVLLYRETGNAAYLGHLAEKYLHLVYGLCLKYLKNREESQDAVMEIFEKATTQLLTQDVTHFKSWLYVVSKNHCLGIIRKKLKSIELEMVTEKSYHDFMEFESLFTLNGDSSSEIIDKILEDCIEKLMQKQQESIKLFYYQQKSYKEISQIMAAPIKKVKSYIQNGKRNLKSCIEAKNE